MKLDLFKLWLFWEKYSRDDRLSTTGVRKLTGICFGWSERDDVKLPSYPFWEQSQFIREVIIAMLRTHWMGKDVIKEVLNWEKGMAKFPKFNPTDDEERKIMGEIIKAIYEFIKDVDSSGKI